MKITNVHAVYLKQPSIANKADGTQDALLVKVETDAGITGLGEVDSSPLVAKAAIEAPFSHSIATGLREVLIGENPFHYEKIWHKMYMASRYAGRRATFIHAMAGIDLALWDIMGKALQMPVWQLLGGGFRTAVRAYASTLFGPTPEATAARARHVMALPEGYTAVKFGWDPLGQDPDADEAHVAAIREAVGPKRDVLIDAGQVYDTKTAIIMAHRFARYNIYWFEEALNPDNLEGYARLSEAAPVRIAAGEADSSRHTYYDLIDIGKIDVVQLDVTRTGLTEGKKVAYYAYDKGRSFINHSFTTDINIAASLHLLAAIPDAPFVEFCVEESPLRRLLAKNPIRVVNGYAQVPMEPGLGVEINEDIVEKYTVRV